MTDRAKEILDACTHAAYRMESGPKGDVLLRNGVCMPCADRAVEVAILAERARIVAIVRRNVDGPMCDGLVGDIEEGMSPP